MVAVAVGHWLVAEPLNEPTGLVVVAPFVWLLGPLERPPAWLPVTGSATRAGVGVVLCLIGWAAVAITGLHVPAWPAALPWVQLVALGGAALALVGAEARRGAAADAIPRRPVGLSG